MRNRLSGIKLPTILPFITMAICFATLYSYLCDSIFLTKFRGDFQPISYMTIIFFFLLSSELIIFNIDNNKQHSSKLLITSFIFIATCILMIIATMMQYDFVAHLEEFLHMKIGKISIYTLVLFTSLNTALLLLCINSSKRYINITAAIISLAVIIFSLAILLSYLHQSPLLYGTEQIPIAFTTSLCFSLSGLSIFLSADSKDLTLNMLFGDEYKAEYAKTIIPAIIILFFVFSITIFSTRSHFPDYSLTISFVSILTVSVASIILTHVFYKIGARLEKMAGEARESKAMIGELSTHLRELYETAIDPLITIDENSMIRDMNNSAAESIGMNRNSILGTNLTHYITNKENAVEMINTAKKDGFCKSMVLSIKNRNGTQTPFICNAMLCKDLSGKRNSIFVALKDISELKAAQERIIADKNRLEESNRELQRIFYMSSHHLHEPLRMITNFLNLLAIKYKGTLSKEADEYITYAVNGALHLQDIINDISAYAQICNHEIAIKLTDSASTLKMALTALAPVIKASHASITNDPLPSIFSDEELIQQVFYQLIDNAIKFSGPKTPAIHISCTHQNGEWIFSVTDNGISIKKEYIPELFDVFKRFVGKEIIGNGIGLPICKKIIDLHHGKIWVESELGKGSTFYFSIPDKLNVIK